MTLLSRSSTSIGPLTSVLSIWALGLLTPVVTAAAPVLDEVIVTARYRAEVSDLVPMAISAKDRVALETWNWSNLDEIQSTAPNLVIARSNGTSSGAIAFIRGIGQQDNLHTFDPGVGIYLDNVYLSRAQGALFKLADVEQVEVLRGPQGALYGKNTTGGAIRILTRSPDMDRTSGSARMSAGNYDRFDLSAGLSAPVVEDKLALSITTLSTNRDGTAKDPVKNRRYNSDNTDAIRTKLLWAPSRSTRVLLSGDYLKEQTKASVGRPEAPLFTIEGAALLGAPDKTFDHKVQASVTGNAQKLKHWGLSLVLEQDIYEDLMLVSTSSLRKLNSDAFHDIDSSPLNLADGQIYLNHKQISQELQAKYTTHSLKLVTGFYFLQEDAHSSTATTASDYVTFMGQPVSFNGLATDQHESRSYSVYMNATLALSDTLSLNAGVRYTDDKKSLSRRVQTVQGAPLEDFGNDYRMGGDGRWDALTPTVALDYRWSQHVMTYVSAAKGYKSGGLNGRANIHHELKPFAPEFVWTYESGLKSNWFDRRFLLNATVFHNDYKDFQATVAEVIQTNFPWPVFTFPVLNAAHMKTYGAEIEFAAQLTDSLQISANAGYLRSKYLEFKDARGDRSNAHPIFAPRWTLNLAADYHIDLKRHGSLKLLAEASYRSHQWLSIENLPSLQQDGYWLLNAGIRWNPEANWYLAAHAKNITNAVYKLDGRDFSSVANIQTAYYGDPRTWTLTAGYRF